MARESDQPPGDEDRVGERIPVSEVQFKGLFEHSNDSIVLHDLDGRILAVNRRASEMLGYPRAALTSMRVRELHPEEALTAAEAIAAYTSGAADAAGCADDHGAVEAGRLAGLTVLSHDVTALPDALDDCRVAATVVRGQVRFEGPA